MADQPVLVRLTIAGAELDAGVSALVAMLLPEGTDVVHRYEPQGTSWARLGRGQRVMVHTWPEHGLATLDLLGIPETSARAALDGLGWRVVTEQPPTRW